MSDTWVSHVWIGEEVVAWGEIEGEPFEARFTGATADRISATEAKADGLIKRAILAAQCGLILEDEA